MLAGFFADYVASKDTKTRLVRLFASADLEPSIGFWGDLFTETIDQVFGADQLSNGRHFRVLNVVDDFSRECVGQLIDTSVSGARLARFLSELSRPLPKTIVCDNGPKLTCIAMFFWSKDKRIKLHFIQPGKPTQNAFVESFNGKFREVCLNQHWFQSLSHARNIINEWRNHYNEVRPHSSLNFQPPAAFARQVA